MRVVITKEAQFDHVMLRRADGSTEASRFPKKGPVPHDAVHYLVEDGLGMTHGFWGLVAAGHPVETIQEMAKSGGHASARRAEAPDAKIVELLQAERLVECFEASLWGGGADPAQLREIARAGCEASHVHLPALSDEAILAITAKVLALNSEWSAAPTGHVFAFEWPEP